MVRILQSFLGGASIKRKLLAIFAVFVVIPILTLTFYFSSNLSDNIMEDSVRFYSSSMEQLKHNIVERLEQYCDIMIATASDSDFISFMNDDFSSDLQAYLAYQEKIVPVMKRMQHIDSDLGCLLLTDKLYQSRITGLIETEHVDPVFTSAFEAARLDKQVSVRWLGTENRTIDKKEDANHILISFPVMDFSSSGGEMLGLLYFILEEKVLYSLMNMEKAAGDNVIVVTDEQDRIITGTVREMVGHDGAEFTGSLVDKADSLMKEYNGNTYICLTSAINNADIGIHDWKIHFMISFEQVQDNISRVWATGVLIALLCIIVSFGIISLFVNNLTRRINALVMNFERVGKGDFTVRQTDDGKDEISVLDRNFQNMVHKLNNLIHEVFTVQLRLKEAEIESQKATNLRKSTELMALQNQINPHYLFNTLESIRMNLVIKGDRKTANIVEVFSESFRNNLYGHGDYVGIREEMDFVRKYLHIQKYRYGDKISYAIHVEKGLEDHPIPRFILQPLIENAIYHGLELKEGQGKLEIDISRKEDNICIAITDDGVGMDEETINYIYSVSETGSGEGGFSAMANIMQRLKLMFGERYKLLIESKKGNYTKVYVLLPSHNSRMEPATDSPNVRSDTKHRKWRVTG